MKCQELSQRIDHTYLKLDIDMNKLHQLVEEVKKYHFRSLVVPPYAVKMIRKFNTKDIRLCSVIAFPHGMTDASIKLREAIYVFENGCDEVDIVSNVFLIKSGLHKEYENELKFIVSSIKEKFPNKIVKIIGEVSVLGKEEVEVMIKIVNKVKPDFFKTSTGYGLRGVSKEDVIKIRSLLDKKIKLKASGGIRTFSQAVELISSGADVIGTSSAVKILEECYKTRGNRYD